MEPGGPPAEGEGHARFLARERAAEGPGREGQLALAWFDFMQGLEREGDNLFVNNADQKVRIGAPGSSLFGRTLGGQIEAANVDLAQEFSDLIIIQRGYQASSQVIGVANEMIQQLLDINRRR